MFGQYSSQFVGRKTKRAMVEGAQRRHPGGTIIDARKVANNTLQYTVENPGGKRSGYTYISLHDTDIISVHKDGDITIDTGGFNTPTTRDRINQFGRPLGVRVHTAKGVLHVNGVPCHRRAWVYPGGKVKSDMGERNLDRLRSELDSFMAEWKAEGLPADSVGDPWILSASIGEDTMRDWVRTRYVFRNFAFMAFVFSGLTEQDAAMWLHDIDRRGGKLDGREIGKLRRFARRHMGLA